MPAPTSATSTVAPPVTPGTRARRPAPSFAAPLAVALSALLWLLSGAPARAQQGDTADWSGNWETHWRDGGAALMLEQDGAAVRGTYPLYDGRIEATAAGRELRGRWIEPGRTGTFIFVQSRDGLSFTGRFESGEWWTGARGGAAEAPFFVPDQSSPMAAMRSFLTAANAAGDGNLEAIGAAVAMVRLPEDTEGDEDRFDVARALFAVIDQTTFRLWNLPREGDRDDEDDTDSGSGDIATAVLEQSGTGETFRVTFERIDGLWYLQPPPMDQLAAVEDRLRTARNAATEARQFEAGQSAAGQSAAGPPEAAQSGAGQSGAGQSRAGQSGAGPRSPREAMRGFLLSFRYTADGSHPDARATLDLRGRPEVTRAHDGEVLAGYLKRVIDRTGYVLWQEIPDDPVSDRPYVHFEHPEGDVVIAPVRTGDGVIWQFTPDTLYNIRRVYAAVEDMPVVPGIAPPADDDVHFAIRGALRSLAPGSLSLLGPFERWQWVALVATALLAVAAAQLANGLTGALARRSGAGAAPDQPVGDATLAWSVRGLAAALVLFAANWMLGLPDEISLVFTTFATILGVIALFLLSWQGVGALADRYRQAERITGHNLILLSLVSGVLRGLLLIAAVVAIAYMLSLPITGVLAGFGIGGIAFALAVQPTLQNLLSGFTIFADRPISVGDFCRFGDKMGTVEHIGLRSTRLRTLDRTVISVPNSQFLDMELENFARRDRFLFTTTLQLRYETSPDQMRYVLVALRKLLIAHPMVLADPLRVRLMGFGAHSLDIEVFCYVLASDIDAFCAIREDVLLRIMTEVEEAGAQFAFPSVVHYQAQDAGMSAERVGQVESAVEDWRREGDLPFPDFDWQSKAEISGSLNYPPDGSVLNEATWTGPEKA